MIILPDLSPAFFSQAVARDFSAGRADIVADHPCGTYIFGLKVDRQAEIALSKRKPANTPNRTASPVNRCG